MSTKNFAPISYSSESGLCFHSWQGTQHREWTYGLLSALQRVHVPPPWVNYTHGRAKANVRRLLGDPHLAVLMDFLWNTISFKCLSSASSRMWSQFSNADLRIKSPIHIQSRKPISKPPPWNRCSIFKGTTVLTLRQMRKRGSAGRIWFYTNMSKCWND